MLGIARISFHGGEFAKAAGLFDQVSQQYPQSHAAPEAIWYRGISNMKVDGNPAGLKATRLLLQEKYPQSIWAEKASAWGA